MSADDEHRKVLLILLASLLGCKFIRSSEKKEESDSSRTINNNYNSNYPDENAPLFTNRELLLLSSPFITAGSVLLYRYIKKLFQEYEFSENFIQLRRGIRQLQRGLEQIQIIPARNLPPTQNLGVGRNTNPIHGLEERNTLYENNEEYFRRSELEKNTAPKNPAPKTRPTFNAPKNPAPKTRPVPYKKSVDLIKDAVNELKKESSDKIKKILEKTPAPTLDPIMEEIFAENPFDTAQNKILYSGGTEGLVLIKEAEKKLFKKNTGILEEPVHLISSTSVVEENQNIIFLDELSDIVHEVENEEEKGKEERDEENVTTKLIKKEEEIFQQTLRTNDKKIDNVLESQSEEEIQQQYETQKNESDYIKEALTADFEEFSKSFEESILEYVLRLINFRNEEYTVDVDIIKPVEIIEEYEKKLAVENIKGGTDLYFNARRTLLRNINKRFNEIAKELISLIRSKNFNDQRINDLRIGLYLDLTEYTKTFIKKIKKIYSGNNIKIPKEIITQLQNDLLGTEGSEFRGSVLVLIENVIERIQYNLSELEKLSKVMSTSDGIDIFYKKIISYANSEQGRVFEILNENYKLSSYKPGTPYWFIQIRSFIKSRSGEDESLKATKLYLKKFIEYYEELEYAKKSVVELVNSQNYKQDIEIIASFNLLQYKILSSTETVTNEEIIRYNDLLSKPILIKLSYLVEINEVTPIIKILKILNVKPEI